MRGSIGISPLLGTTVATVIMAAVATAAKRAGVNVVGGPVKAPLCDRPEGKLQTRCPDSHPFNYGAGDLHCCRFEYEVTDESGNPQCDPSRKLNYNSDMTCCPPNERVNCTDAGRGCHRADNIVKTDCPSTHPFNFGEGFLRCCSYPYEVGDEGNALCNSTRKLGYHSDLSCCRLGQHVDCGDPDAGCHKPEDTVETPCPSTHPYNYGEGDLKCCKFEHEIGGGNPNCNSSRKLNYYSEVTCCPSGQYVDCTNTETGCHRADNIVQTGCPATHPYSFGDGYAHCCRYPYEVNNRTVNPDCDSTRKLSYNSAVACCPLGDHVSCPDADRGCTLMDNVMTTTCVPKPTVTSSHTVGDPRFAVETVLDHKACEDFEQDGLYNFWLSPDLAADQNFVVDLGCDDVKMGTFEVRNAVHGHWKDRGTKDFTIEVSSDQASWTTAVTERLPDPLAHDPCEVPTYVYPPDGASPIQGRYVRFTVVSFYGSGGGLSHFRPHYVTEAEPRCPGEFKVIEADAQDGDSPVEVLFTDNGCDEMAQGQAPQGNFWHNDAADTGFILDYGCSFSFAVVEFRNSRKNVYRGHGTKYFEVLVSDDNAAWTSAVYAKMRNPNTEYKCGEAPLERFHVDGGVARGRYVKFVAKSGYQTHVALQYFNLVPYDKREGKPCQPALSIVSEADPLNTNTGGENIFTRGCNNPWLLPNDVLGEGFILDYGCEMLVTQFDIRNTNNMDNDDRGTKDFEIHVSKDATEWTQVVSGTLPDLSGVTCEDHSPMKFFPSTGPKYARYVKFLAISKIDMTLGVGLDYFKAHFKGLEASGYHCASNVVIDSSSDEHLVGFPTKSIFSDGCEVVDQGVANYYLAKTAQSGESFVLDYGCPIITTKIQIKNVRHNAGGAARSTNDFIIETSMDKKTWTEVVSGNLPDLYGVACADIPLDDFIPNGKVAMGRFFRITLVSYHASSNGAGLKYLNIMHDQQDIIASTTCDPTITVQWTEPYLNNDPIYHPQNVIGDNGGPCDATDGDGGYWVPQRSSGTNPGYGWADFTFGCTVYVAEFEATNGQHGTIGGRGAKNILYMTKSEGGDWLNNDLAIHDSFLTDPDADPKCTNARMVTAIQSGPVKALTVRMVLKSVYYGNGAALTQFIPHIRQTLPVALP